MRNRTDWGTRALSAKNYDQERAHRTDLKVSKGDKARQVRDGSVSMAQTFLLLVADRCAVKERA